MISAGAMRRRVRIEAFTETRDPESNEAIQTWAPVAEVWASRRDTSAREFVASGGGDVAEQVAVFTVWWRDGITTEQRIVSQGQTFEIIGLSEIGERYQLQIQARARGSETSP